jgi:hypothetical protein
VRAPGGSCCPLHARHTVSAPHSPTPRHTPTLPHLQGAPYLLEQMAEGVASELPSVRLALLTAACQLFFKRPPECKPLLGTLLSACLSDPDQDVRDRALMYYRWAKLHSVGIAICLEAA